MMMINKYVNVIKNIKYYVMFYYDILPYLPYHLKVMYIMLC